jgi:UDP-N-acetylglucosamine--N-acetylmuramyl-(pentapeptide) pyrophosphoryl-undecaprenol N-acetylglucosamine transferase
MTSPSPLKVVIATGGSGGHLFPALSVGKYLRKEGHEVLFIGTFGVGKEKLESEGFSYINLYAKGLTSKRPDILFLTILRMLKALAQSIQELRRYRPDVVSGFGGYGSFPVVLAAIFLNIPTLIHEQNVVPGRANKWLSRYVKKIALSFQDTKKYFSFGKVLLTGCPTHISTENIGRQRSLEFLGVKPGKFTILVVGGSQGSHYLNKVFLKTAIGLSQKMDFQVIHISGKKDYMFVCEQYAASACSSKVFDFFNHMAEAYTAADLVISRAGALTITELAMFKKPSILIPYPHAAGHQKENALTLVTRGLAEIIDEKDLTPQVLLEMILEMYDHDLKEISQGEDLFKEIYITDATQKIAKGIVELKDDK